MKPIHRRTLCCILAASAALCSVSVLAKSPTLEKIRSSGTITLGYREASVPFSYLGTNQKPVGFSLDLCATVVERVKTELKVPKLDVAYVPVNPSNRIPLLQNGTIDIECGSTTNTAERQKQVAFSVATFVSQPSWLTLSGSSVSSTKALRGKTVVITQASLNYPIAVRINNDEKLGMTIVQAKDHAESLLMVRTGRAAAFFEDNILIAGLVSGSPDPKAFRFLPDQYDGFFYYGLMLPKDDTDFKSLVDRTLQTMMQDGTFSELYAKWFTAPIPPKGQVIGLPMSEALRSRVANPSDALTP